VRASAKVTIDSLQEVVYEKSIGTEMNDLDLCLEFVLRSCQPLRYIRRWIYRKPLEMQAWFQRTPIGNVVYVESNGHVTGQTSDPNTFRAQYVGNSWRCYLATIANYYLVCCEAVWSIILSTAWLLVGF